jgi:hypothetical protein
MNRPVLVTGAGHDRLPSEMTSQQQNYAFSRQSASGYDKPFEAFRGLAWDRARLTAERRAEIRKRYPPIPVDVQSAIE